jgi:hypothetical protein
LARWNVRKAQLERYRPGDSAFVRRERTQRDSEMLDAMGAYDFHRREVVRLAAQIQAAATLRSMYGEGLL